MQKTDVTKLVTKIRQGSQKAREALINCFKPLIFTFRGKERYSNIREDIESICYEAICRAVKCYKGVVTEKFPGYIKKYLEFTLNNAAKKKRRYFQRRGQEISEGKISLAEDFTVNLLAGIDLLKALRKLSLRERYIIWARYFQGYELTPLARLLKTNRFALYREIKSILQKMRSWCK